MEDLDCTKVNKLIFLSSIRGSPYLYSLSFKSYSKDSVEVEESYSIPSDLFGRSTLKKSKEYSLEQYIELCKRINSNIELGALSGNHKRPKNVKNGEFYNVVLNNILYPAEFFLSVVKSIREELKSLKIENRSEIEKFETEVKLTEMFRGSGKAEIISDKEKNKCNVFLASSRKKYYLYFLENSYFFKIKINRSNENRKKIYKFIKENLDRLNNIYIKNYDDGSLDMSKCRYGADILLYSFKELIGFKQYNSIKPQTFLI